MSDHSLRDAVMRALAESPHVDADEIAIDVHPHGEVILRGTVGSPLEHVEAARTARRVNGVRKVDDRLRVNLMGRDGRADADTEAAVLDALIADHELHRFDLDVRVHDGTASLRGMVELAHQRERAQRIALRVPGVADVRNEVGVWLAVSANDVAERVTEAIGLDAIDGADRIEVEVRDRDVILSGVVGSDEHRDIARVAALGVPGVATVDDELTVRSR